MLELAAQVWHDALVDAGQPVGGLEPVVGRLPSVLLDPLRRKPPFVPTCVLVEDGAALAVFVERAADAAQPWTERYLFFAGSPQALQVSRLAAQALQGDEWDVCRVVLDGRYLWAPDVNMWRNRGLTLQQALLATHEKW